MGLRLLWQPAIAVIVTHDDCVVVFLANKFSLSLSVDLANTSHKNVPDRSQYDSQARPTARYLQIHKARMSKQLVSRDKQTKGLSTCFAARFTISDRRQKTRRQVTQASTV